MKFLITILSIAELVSQASDNIPVLTLALVPYANVEDLDELQITACDQSPSTENISIDWQAGQPQNEVGIGTNGKRSRPNV
jgi:hypothetical protein